MVLLVIFWLSCYGAALLHSACRCLVQVDPQPQAGMFTGWFKKKQTYIPDLVSPWHACMSKLAIQKRLHLWNLLLASTYCAVCI